MLQVSALPILAPRPKSPPPPVVPKPAPPPPQPVIQPVVINSPGISQVFCPFIALTTFMFFK